MRRKVMHAKRQRAARHVCDVLVQLALWQLDFSWVVLTHNIIKQNKQVERASFSSFALPEKQCAAIFSHTCHLVGSKPARYNDVQ